MDIKYVLDTVPSEKGNIFLAGPTYRDPEKYSKSWRFEAIKFFEEMDFKGMVFVPEWKNGVKPHGWTYSRQISWEVIARKYADIILYWIPRNLKELPGFTTNIEFGEDLKTGKMVIGIPKDAEKCEYIRERCSQNDLHIFDTLESTCNEAVKILQEAEPGNFYFTSDTHFGNHRTLKLSKRPFSSVKEMDKQITYQFMDELTYNDTLFHLGDFGDPIKFTGIPCKEMLFLPGNYDTPDIVQALSRFPNVTILNPMLNKNVKFKHKKIGEVNLVHEPEKAIEPNRFYLFGHIHKLQMIKRNGLNVGVDCHNYRPIDVDTIEFYKTAIEKHYDENVYMERLGE